MAPRHPTATPGRAGDWAVPWPCPGRPCDRVLPGRVTGQGQVVDLPRPVAFFDRAVWPGRLGWAGGGRARAVAAVPGPGPAKDLPGRCPVQSRPGPVTAADDEDVTSRRTVTSQRARAWGLVAAQLMHNIRNNAQHAQQAGGAGTIGRREKTGSRGQRSSRSRGRKQCYGGRWGPDRPGPVDRTEPTVTR